MERANLQNSQGRRVYSKRIASSALMSLLRSSGSEINQFNWKTRAANYGLSGTVINKKLIML